MGAVGYFGLSYVQENEGAIKAVEVDDGDGCVAPTVETVMDGSYKPLGRPLFIYVKNASYKDKPQAVAPSSTSTWRTRPRSPRTRCSSA